MGQLMNTYEPTNWQAGDTITSAKLNKLEQGVKESSESGGVFVMDIVKKNNDSTSA